MKTHSVKNLALESNEEILASHDFNDERTVAFHSMRKKHKKDSIAWIIGGLLLFFFTLISLGRITIIGQFFDDSIFNLIFGWFKFPVYFVLLSFDICIYLGVYFKFKKRFLLMVGLTSALICWTISLILLTYIYDQQKVIGGVTIEGLWSKNMFKNSFDIYWSNWLEHSIYSGNYAKADKMELLISAKGYFNLYSGGGILGIFLAATSAYLSIPAAFILVAGLFFLNGSWLFTGDPFFLFKAKDKRKGHALRILSLKGKNNPNKPKKKNHSEKDDYQIWKSLNVFDPNVESEIGSSDLTIKMPSYAEAEKEMNLKEFAEDMSADQKIDLSEIKKTLYEEPILIRAEDETTTDLDPNELDQPVFFQSRRKKEVLPKENNPITSTEKIRYEDIETVIHDMPPNGHYGDLDPNVARKLFEKDTNVTPFGRQNDKPKSEETTISQEVEQTSDDEFFEELYNEDQSSTKLDPK